MYVITFEGQAAAHVTAADISVADWVQDLGDYVVGRWMVCLAVFAQSVADGRACGPFTDWRAEHFARCALMPDDEFDQVADFEDYLIAGHFDVPVQQVAAKREDRRLAALGEI